jgi:hypothetical protein
VPRARAAWLRPRVADRGGPGRIAIGGSAIGDLSELFRRVKTTGDLARRILSRLTLEPPEPEALTRPMPAGVPWIVLAQAVGERGATAVPGLIAALAALPLPAVQNRDEEDPGGWMRDEGSKYRLLYALCVIGPPAAAAIPLLEAIADDGEAYRDSWHMAGRALESIRAKP